MRLSLLFILSFLILPTHASQVPSSKEALQPVLRDMSNSDSSVRGAALRRLLAIAQSASKSRSSEPAKVFNEFCASHPEVADDAKLGLIRMLEAENKSPNETNYPEAIQLVSSLDDVGAIPALVDAMTTGLMAKDGLLKFGERALEPILAKLHDPDIEVRASAFGLSFILLNRRGDSASQFRIQSMVIEALSDPDINIRLTGVSMAKCSKDAQRFIPQLDQMSRTDPYMIRRKSSTFGTTERYPGRLVARRTLQGIRDGLPVHCAN